MKLTAKSWYINGKGTENDFLVLTANEKFKEVVKLFFELKETMRTFKDMCSRIKVPLYARRRTLTSEYALEEAGACFYEVDNALDTSEYSLKELQDHFMQIAGNLREDAEDLKDNRPYLTLSLPLDEGDVEEHSYSVKGSMKERPQEKVLLSVIPPSKEEEEKINKGLCLVCEQRKANDCFFCEDCIQAGAYEKLPDMTDFKIFYELRKAGGRFITCEDGQTKYIPPYVKDATPGELKIILPENIKEFPHLKELQKEAGVYQLQEGKAPMMLFPLHKEDY